MAVLNGGMTLYEDNNTQANWAGSDDLDLEVSVDGLGSESWLVGKNSNETATLTKSANMGASKYFTFYMKSDWGAFYTQIDVSLLDGTNTNLFVVATGGKATIPNPNPEISGDFKPSILQITEGSAGGTYNPVNHAQTVFNVDASSSGNIRAIVNHWIDVMYYGDGRVISGTTATDKMFSESDALDVTSAKFDGCSKLFDAGLAFYTDIEIATTVGNSYGEVVTWFGKSTTDGLFKLLVTGTADFINTILIGATGVKIALDASSATAFGMAGGGITNGGNIDFGTGQTIDGAVLVACNQIDTNGAIFTNCTIASTTEVATGALVINSPAELANIANITFNTYTGKYAVYIPATVTGTITLNGFFGDGSGTDVYWAGTGGTLTINKAGGTNFTTSNSAGGTVLLVASVAISVNVKDQAGANVVGALVYIDEDLGVAGEIVNTVTDGNGDVNTSYSGVATSATVRVRKYGFKPSVGTISLASDSQTNVVLITDPQQI